MDSSEHITQSLWSCPDPSCKYKGTPAIHVLNLPKGHAWSAAQVVDTLNPKKRYPFNWAGSEGV